MFKRIKVELDIQFITKCKELNLIPKFCRLKLPNRHELSKKDVLSTYKRFMDTQLNNRKKARTQLQKSVNNLKVNMKSTVSFLSYISILKLLRSSSATCKKSVENRQANKLHWLGGPDRTCVTLLDKDKIVFNLSSHKLSDVELQLLSRGLDFNMPPHHHLDPTDTMTSFETFFNQAKPGVKGNINRLKHRLKSLCYQYIYNKVSQPTISSEEKSAFIQLLKNSDIIIARPDKGKGVVLMDRCEYLSKLYTIVNDSSKFTQLSHDPTEKRENRLQNFLYRLFKKGQLDEHTYKRIRPTGSVPSQLYGLPKLHKDNIPLRPIISQIGSYTYELAKFLVPILAPLTTNDHTIKDSFSFIQELLSIKSAPYMSSFDVVSLFTNIPLEETINICLDKLYANTDKVNNITRINLKKLITLASKENHFMFDGKFFDQTDGVSMGSPLGPILANIFMCKLETEALTNYLGILPLVYKRYVDDCFLIFGSAQQSQVFFNYLNKQHHSIKFTMEEEQNNILPFLDIKIIRKDDGFLSTSVFHKPTYSGLYLQWSSFVPKQYKLGLVNCLLYRAWKICSDEEYFNEEVNFIKKTLSANGYPLNFLNSCVQKFMKSKYSAKVKDVIYGPKLKDVYISLPYKGKQSTSLR